MTKTEYREYIASEAWRERRKEYLQGYDRCNRCDVPRHIAIIAYDQDLHVHHRSYARVGAELDTDLEALCRCCHEIETFGVSQLHVPVKPHCSHCGAEDWEPYCGMCMQCDTLLHWQIQVSYIETFVDLDTLLEYLALIERLKRKTA